MPKKFTGENTKATAAKERKLHVKSQALAKKDQDKDDQEWVEKSKKVEKKLIRKEIKVEKRQEYLNRKNELKELLKKESEVISAKKQASAKKLTLHEIEKKLLESAPKSKPIVPETLTANLNRLTLGEEIARTIDAALALLDTDPLPDKHPEKRRKGEFKAFEEKRLKELKAAHPTLKLSQLKEMVFKEWQKSTKM